MEIILIKTIQFIMAISLLVLLHEGGHFFFSKLFGVRVNKFYIFFDWKFSLFKKKIGETEYGVGWLPLGGYCQIEGMIDETQHDVEKLKAPAQPWEFRSKPCWQRLFIMIGGVMVNFILALFIYSMVLFAWGDSYISLKDMNLGMKFSEQAKELGFKDGDVILGTDKGDVKDFGADLYRDLAEAHYAMVKRDGKEVKISLPGDLNLLEMMKSEPSFVRPLTPASIDTVFAQPALKYLKAGDVITGLNGDPIDSKNALDYQIGRLADAMTDAKTHKDSIAVRTVEMTILRAGKTDTLSMVLSPELTIGIACPSIYKLYEPTTIEYSFIESFPAGINYGMNVLGGYVGDLKYLASADGAKSLGGFGAIGSLFPATWDWHAFWLMTAFLSIVLAFMNILPIPALDGGHVVFLLYEMITRRKPSEKFMVVAEYVGFGILLLLMVFANLNDILRALGIMY